MTDNNNRSDQAKKGYTLSLSEEEIEKELAQVIIECQYVDKLQSLLDYCNRHILKNFQLNLVMEYDNLETKEEEFKLK